MDMSTQIDRDLVRDEANTFLDTDELQPIVLAQVTAVTGSVDTPGEDDHNVVWGNIR